MVLKLPCRGVQSATSHRRGAAFRDRRAQARLRPEPARIFPARSASQDAGYGALAHRCGGSRRLYRLAGEMTPGSIHEDGEPPAPIECLGRVSERIPMIAGRTDARDGTNPQPAAFGGHGVAGHEPRRDARQTAAVRLPSRRLRRVGGSGGRSQRKSGFRRGSRCWREFAMRELIRGEISRSKIAVTAVLSQTRLATTSD